MTRSLLALGGVLLVGLGLAGGRALATHDQGRVSAVAGARQEAPANSARPETPATGPRQEAPATDTRQEGPTTGPRREAPSNGRRWSPPEIHWSWESDIWGWGWEYTHESETTLRQTIQSVNIENDSGSVRIRTGTGPVTVHQRLAYHQRNTPSDAFRVTGSQLVLGACGYRCSASYDVVIPAGLSVTGHLDAGDLDVAGAGSVDVVSDSGDVRGSDLHGPAVVQADSGDVTLTLAHRNDVTVRADSGSVDVTVPHGAYRVSGSTDSGDRRINIGQDPSAGKTLDLTTDTGDVYVHGA